MLGFVGGIFGIILGAAMSGVITLYAKSMLFPLNANVTLQLVIFALSFSVVAGVISGVWPARKAAKMNPVDALRYE